MTKKRVKRDPIEQPLDQSIRFIPLTKGQVAIVDAHIFDWLNEYNWCATRVRNTSKFYAVRMENRVQIAMHREITGTNLPEVDHQNNNGLDNRGTNLRPCNRSQNQWNRRVSTKKSSDAPKGVYPSPRGRPWIAKLTQNKKTIHIGMFDTKEEGSAAVLKYISEHRDHFASV